MATVRVVVCGSRDFDEPGLIGATLNALHEVYEFSLVIDGGAKGADTKASIWAMAKGVDSHTYVAQWDRDGKRAGILRNCRMLESGKPSLVIGFVNKPLAESKGTAHMIGIARAKGVKTIVVEVQ